jgi:hypothetical protein
VLWHNLTEPEAVFPLVFDRLPTSMDKDAGYANKTICRKTLENGTGADRYLRCNVAVTLGGDDLGLRHS